MIRLKPARTPSVALDIGDPEDTDGHAGDDIEDKIEEDVEILDSEDTSTVETALFGKLDTRAAKTLLELNGGKTKFGAKARGEGPPVLLKPIFIENE